MPLFRGYASDYFQVGAARIDSSLIIHQLQLERPWRLERFERMTTDHLEWLTAEPPELLLLGSGRTTRFPPQAVCDWLRQRRIPFESMDSRAAARTWNILMGEGRRASCALLLPGA